MAATTTSSSHSPQPPPPYTPPQNPNNFNPLSHSHPSPSPNLRNNPQNPPLSYSLPTPHQTLMINPQSPPTPDQSEYLSFSDFSTTSSSSPSIYPSISSPDTQNPNSSSQTQQPTLLHISFNQDHTCFAAATSHGFRIFNSDPFRPIFRRDFFSSSSSSSPSSPAGIGFVAMLFRCNILALIGGGPNPQYPPTKVMLWDDHQSRCIGELSFRSEVRAVRLRRDKIIAILMDKIFVYNFADLKLLHRIDTVSNPLGLCEVSQVSGSMVLVCLGVQKGQVRVEDYGSRRSRFITAHYSSIKCFALTQDGRLLATSSSKGTLIRIFNTLDGSLLQEVWVPVLYYYS